MDDLQEVKYPDFFLLDFEVLAFLLHYEKKSGVAQWSFNRYSDLFDTHDVIKILS